MSTLKGKNLLPQGANSFPFRVDLFRREAKTILTELSSLKVCQFCLTPDLQDINYSDKGRVGQSTR